MDQEKKKMRTEAEKRALCSRASRIEGQLRGVRKMIEGDAYCVDVLTQLSAIRAAVQSLSREILIDHLSSCVKAGVERGDEQVLQEFCQTLKQFVK